MAGDPFDHNHKEEFRMLAEYINSNYGIQLRAEKQALVMGRLQNVLLENNFHSFSEYFNYVVRDKTEKRR